MGDSERYEIHAVRYGHFERRSGENFLGGDTHDVAMPLDYFVWAIVGKKRTFIVDTGFDKPTGDKRGRSVVRPVDEGLAAIGINHADVSDVIISHINQPTHEAGEGVVRGLLALKARGVVFTRLDDPSFTPPGN